MQIVFGKSKWELPDASLGEYLERVKADGFDAAEFYVPHCTESASEIRSGVADNELFLIAQMGTEGDTPRDHIASLEKHVGFAAECGAELINSQTARDFFPFEENIRIFERSIELSNETGIPIANETHRSRPTYSAIETRRYLEALPDLRITADFSHWMVVHESDLRDQMDNVRTAMEKTIHIHARIGFEEGPQVNDPRAPEWETHFENHLALWRDIAALHRERSAERLTVTPEFGPLPYVPTKPYTQEPLVDVWEANVFMRERVAAALAV